MKLSRNYYTPKLNITHEEDLIHVLDFVSDPANNIKISNVRMIPGFNMPSHHYTNANKKYNDCTHRILMRPALLNTGELQQLTSILEMYKDDIILPKPFTYYNSIRKSYINYNCNVLFLKNTEICTYLTLVFPKLIIKIQDVYQYTAKNVIK
jgi:hypothetical protein